MRIPRPIKSLKAKRTAKKQARRDTLKAELQKELDHKTVEQLQDEAAKKRIQAENRRAAQDQMMEHSARDLDRARTQFARSLDRMAKTTRRMQGLINWLTVPFILVEAIMLGRDLTQHDWNDAIIDGFFVVIFSLILLGRYIDLQTEARRGAELRQEQEEKNEKEALERKLAHAKELGRREAQAELGIDEDTKNSSPVSDMLHEIMLRAALEKVTAKVMDEAVKEKFGSWGKAEEAGFLPTEEHAREIERRFKKLTGHTVTLEWDEGGWNADLDDGHENHSHDANESPAPTTATQEPETPSKPANSRQQRAKRNKNKEGK